MMEKPRKLAMYEDDPRFPGSSNVLDFATPDLVRAIDQLMYAVQALRREIMTAANPPGHQAPGSKEVELPKDDGYAAKLPKR